MDRIMSDATVPRRRGLFRYFDSTKYRYGDILAIQFRLQRACPGGDVDRLGLLLDAIAPPTNPEGTDAETPVRPDPLAAMVELAPIVGLGFDLPPYSEEDGSGFNVRECIELLTDFFAEIAAQEAEETAPIDPGVEPEVVDRAETLPDE